MIEPCVFCSVSEGDSERYASFIGSVGPEILISTLHAFLAPDIAPLMEGHMLAISRRHVGSSAQLTPQESTELDSLIKAATNFSRVAYSLGVVCFEHGSNGFEERLGNACIMHCHVHIVPLADDTIIDVIRALEDELGPAQGGQPNDEYIAVSALAPTKYWAPKEPRSQFVRRTIASAIGEDSRGAWASCLGGRQLEITRSRINRFYAAWAKHGGNVE